MRRLRQLFILVLQEGLLLRVRLTLFLGFVWVFLCFFSAPSFSQEGGKSEWRVRPNHREDVLKRLFLDSVITSGAYNDQLLNPDEIAVTKTSYPWLYPHLVPENGVPKPLAVNKWTQPIVISFGMPNDLKPFQQISENRMRPYQFTELPVRGAPNTDRKWTGIYYKLNDPVADMPGYGGFPIVES